MSTTLTLEKRHFQAAVQKARELGKTPRTYIQSLIDAATLTLDDILSPVRKGFAASGVTACHRAPDAPITAKALA